MDDNRFIEETFPVKEVSVESVREKNIRHGHISALHIWWARRPLASSRATSYAALIPAPKNIEERNLRRQFIIQLSKWANSLNQSILETARRDILEANGGKPPKVLDPFAGGGAIPLAALQLGCETYASDYNPVATLILKCTLEYPQRYGGHDHSSWSEHGLSSDKKTNPLVNEVKKWGNWVLKETEKEMGRFYPVEKDGSIPTGYIWARTIPCQNPSCNTEIPLMRQYWLANKNTEKVSVYPYVTNGEVRFKIVGNGHEPIPKGFDPSKGNILTAIATCLACGSVTDGKTLRRLFSQGKSEQRMVAIVLHDTDYGKKYRVANKDDVKTFREAEEYLQQKRKALIQEFGTDPVPDEFIHTPDGREYQPGNLLYNFTPVMLYGMTKWGDLFNSRQKLAMTTFVDKVRDAYKKMLEEKLDAEYAKVIVSYLALVLSRHSSYNARLCWWEPLGERGFNVFGRQALPMVFDYAEQNPFGVLTGNWATQVDVTANIISHLSMVSMTYGRVTQSSATSLPYPDDFFDAVLTDPPYYDNVPYAVLSDFFYVWLKRAVGELYPDLFSTPLTPKSNEAIAELPLLRGMGKEKASKVVEGIKTREHFENMLLQSFKEIRRVLKPNGISIIVYTHKSTAGWETLVNSLTDSGLVVTSTWPIHTEMKTRLRASESAALASSIYMVTRKLQRQQIEFYKEVKDNLKEHLGTKLDRLWNQGISGADFFIAAIGASIEVFGKYEKIIDDEGNVIRADRLLEDVRRIVTEYAVRQVLHNGIAGEIKPMTRFYVLWRWAYSDAKVHFDDARKLAQSTGIDLAQEWNKGFIQKDKEFIRVLGPEDRNLRELEGSKELIDVLHLVVLLWKKGRNDEIVKVLKETGVGKTDTLYRVALAISESLPNGSKEKKMLEGFLSGKERISEDVRKESTQTRLFE